MKGYTRKLFVAVLAVLIVGGAAGSYFYWVMSTVPKEERAGSGPGDVGRSSPPVFEADQADAETQADKQDEPSDAAQPPQPESSAEQSVSVEQCARYLSAACREAARDEDFAIELLRHHVETNPQARSAMRAIGMQMRPFRFAGQVVNPDGEPIADAEVVYRIGLPFSLGHTEPATTTTDEQGRFRIEARGYSLFIRTIRHPGLTPAPNFDENRHFGPDPRKGHISWEAATPGSPKELVLMRGPSSE